MNEVALAIELAASLVEQGAQVMQTLKGAAAEGRTTLTAAEWSSMLASANTAQAAVAQLLGNAPPQGA